MAKHIVLIREGYRLVPADPASYELIETLKEHKAYSVEIKESRSRGELGLYFAGLSLLVENFSDEDDTKWPTSRHLHTALLESLGYTHKLWRIDGQFKIEVDSVAFDKMSDEEFKVFFERARAIVIKLWGVDPWDEWLKVRDTNWQEWWGRNHRPWDSD